MNKKPIAITMGEPSGISSEIILKTWLKREKENLPCFFIIDDFNKIKFVNQLFKLNVKFKLISKPEEAKKYFKALRRHQIDFPYDGQGDYDALAVAF